MTDPANPSRTLFTGLSAFPLTPIRDEAIDEAAYVGLIGRLVAASVDSITALGSTGSYVYFTPDERARIARLTVEHAAGVPVFVGVGALRTREVLANVRAAEAAGAQGLLLAPVSYQPLTADDVFELFRTVTSATDLPVVVYDNPGTTHFTFTTDLYARLAALDGVASIKIPGLAMSPPDFTAHVDRIRAATSNQVSIGISGDAFGAAGLNAGCDAWYTAVGGTVPTPMLAITRAARSGDTGRASELSAQLQPLWDLFAEFGGSLRVTAAIAEHLGLVGPRPCPCRSSASPMSKSERSPRWLRPSVLADRPKLSMNHGLSRSCRWGRASRPGTGPRPDRGPNRRRPTAIRVAPRVP